MSRRRLLGFAAVIAALLALLILTPVGSMLRGLVSEPGQKTGTDHRDGHSGPEGSKGIPSKTDRRPIRPRPTVEETEALLENTIIPEADFSDLTLSERISSLNKFIEDAGVDRRNLRVVLSHRVARHPMGSEVRWGRVKLRNVPVSTILQYMTGGKGPLRYHTGEGTVEVGLRGDPGDESQSEADIRAKLDTFTIPVIDFEDTTVEEARDFLISRSIELDNATLEPTRKGLWIVLREPRAKGNSPNTATEPDAEGDPEGNVPIRQRTLNWRALNISLTSALDEITRRTGLQWKIDDFAITISPADTAPPLDRHPKAAPPDPDEPSGGLSNDTHPPAP